MITADTLRAIPLLAEIPEHEHASIATRAADVNLHAGEWLMREGDAPSFFALLEASTATICASSCRATA